MTLKWATAVPDKVKSLSASGKTSQAVALNAFYQGGIKGPLADFVAYGEDEERLSNWIQTTGAANPLAELLAMDPDDGAFESRMKNVA